MSTTAISKRRKNPVVNKNADLERYKKALKESQELSEQLEKLSIQDLKIPIPDIDFRESNNSTSFIISQSQQLSAQFQLANQYLNTYSIQLGQISTSASLPIRDNIPKFDVKDPETQKIFLKNSTEFKFPIPKPVMTFIGVITAITAIGINVVITAYLTPDLGVFGAGLAGTLVANFVTAVPKAFQDGDKTIFFKQFTAGGVGFLASTGGTALFGSFAGGVVGSIVGNIVIGSLYGTVQPISVQAATAELVSNKIVQDGVTQKLGNDNLQESVKKDIQQTTTKNWKLRVIFATALCSLAALILNGNSAEIASALGSGISLGATLYQGNSAIRAITNQTIASILSPFVLSGIIKFAQKRAEKLLGKYGNASLKDNELVKKHLSERITKQFIFNMTVAQLTNIVIKSVAEQSLKVGIATGIEAAQSNASSVQQYLDNTVKSAEAAAEYIKKAIEQGKTNINEMIFGSIIAAETVPAMNSLMNSVFDPQSFTPDTSTLNDAPVVLNQVEGQNVITSTLENLFDPKSISETTTSFGDFAKNYKEEFYRDYPHIKEWLQYAPHEMQGILWYALTGKASSILHLYEKSKFAINSGVFGVNVLEHELFKGDVTSDSLFHQYMKATDYVDSATGYKKILDLGNFGFEDAVIAAYGNVV
jgi:hypothetical protein